MWSGSLDTTCVGPAMSSAPHIVIWNPARIWYLRPLRHSWRGDRFEGIVYLAISLGGDCVTLTDFEPALAEAYYGVLDELKEKVLTYLPEDLKTILEKFSAVLSQRAGNCP